MAQTYQDLLKKVKQGQPPDETQLEEMRAKAKKMCDELGADLSGVLLKDKAILHELLRRKLVESGYIEFILFNSEPPDDTQGISLAEVILGVYEKAAFNVVVRFWISQRVHVYYWEVPKGGNLRH